VDPALGNPVILTNVATISTTGPERPADKANNTSQVSDPVGLGTVLLGGYAFEDLLVE
jgi:hypothetical protein